QEAEDHARTDRHQPRRQHEDRRERVGSRIKHHAREAETVDPVGEALEPLGEREEAAEKKQRGQHEQGKDPTEDALQPHRGTILSKWSFRGISVRLVALRAAGGPMRIRRASLAVTALLALAAPLFCAETSWRDATRDVYFDGVLDRAIQVFVESDTHRIALVSPRGDDAFVLDRDAGTLSSVPRRPFRL